MENNPVSTPTNFEQLFEELKKYLLLQKELLKFESVEKLTKLFAALIVAALGVLLGTGALFFLFFALAHFLAPAVGSLGLSLALIGVFYLLLIGGIVLFRKPLILQPLVRLLSGLFLNDEDREY